LSLIRTNTQCLKEDGSGFSLGKGEIPGGTLTSFAFDIERRKSL
jgi:hypothetical protein